MKSSFSIVYLILTLPLLCCCGSNGGTSAVSDDKLQYAPEENVVDAVVLSRQDFPMQLLSNGKLIAVQKSSLYFGQPGVVAKVNYANGAKVQKGDVIAELDSREQKAALEAAQIALDKASLDLQDALVGLGYALDAQIQVPEDVLKVAQIRSGYSAALNSYQRGQQSLEATVIRAPFSGKVADVKINAWDFASGAEPFCQVIDDSSYDVEFTVLEQEYSFVNKGQSVKVSLFGNSDYVKGSIVAINPTIDKNGQISVKARITGDSRMLDGMNVRVIAERSLERQLVVPKSAVVIRDGLEVMFRYNEGKADWVYVNILDANSESYAVEANADRAAQLAEGDLVIVSGNLNLADGSKVTLKR